MPSAQSHSSSSSGDHVSQSPHHIFLAIPGGTQIKSIHGTPCGQVHALTCQVVWHQAKHGHNTVHAAEALRQRKIERCGKTHWLAFCQVAKSKFEFSRRFITSCPARATVGNQREAATHLHFTTPPLLVVERRPFPAALNVICLPRWSASPSCAPVHPHVHPEWSRLLPHRGSTGQGPCSHPVQAGTRP